jgi:hypothetical protein
VRPRAYTPSGLCRAVSGNILLFLLTLFPWAVPDLEYARRHV